MFSVTEKTPNGLDSRAYIGHKATPTTAGSNSSKRLLDEYKLKKI